VVNDNGKVIFSISNTGCSYFSRVIEQKLKNMSGIADISVSYLTNIVLVSYDLEKTNVGVIRRSIKKFGYDTVELH